MKGSADLASQLAKEYQTNASAPIIDGIKEELKLLPKVYKMLKGVVPKIEALGEVPTLVTGLRDVANGIVSKMRQHEEIMDAMGDDGDMQSVLCLITKTVAVLEQFVVYSSAKRSCV